MKKLSNNLKRMLNGLAHQDAAEYLSTHDKMMALGVGPETRLKQTKPSLDIVTQQSKRRIAFISDGRGVDAPLAYAIDACSRQGAKIDLLVHGTIDAKIISALQTRARIAGAPRPHRWLVD